MPPYVISLDEKRHTICAVLLGFWDTATTRAYLAELTTAAQRVAASGATSWWLIELGETTVQSREVIEMLSGHLPKIIPRGTMVAVVTPGKLQGMQARRIVRDDTHQHFATRQAAEAWLDAQGRPA